MVVQHNMTAANTNRQLGITNKLQQSSTEKLSTGYRINRAADDAAGLSISEKMRNQIRGLNKASSNAQTAVSLIQTAEGALDETHSILQRMNELATQAANDTNTTVDRNAIQLEMNQLASEINRISSTTQFNTQNLIDGTFTAKNIQVGSLRGQKIELSITAMSAGALFRSNKGDVADGTNDTIKNEPAKNGTDKIAKMIDNGNLKVGSTVLTANLEIGDKKNATGTTDDSTKKMYIDVTTSATTTQALYAEIDVSNFSTSGATMTFVQAAIERVSSMRSTLGSVQNRLEHTIKNLDAMSENTQAAESLIRDTDMATEMVNFSKNNILAQAGQSMLAQANQSNQGVLSLLG